MTTPDDTRARLAKILGEHQTEILFSNLTGLAHRWECTCGASFAWPDGLRDARPVEEDAHNHVSDLLAAALRDSGWVDPEEAARLRTSRDMYQSAYMSADKVLDRALGSNEEDGAGEGLAADVALLAQHRDEARAERDALLPVVEAAKVLLETWDGASFVDPDDWQIAAGYMSMISVQDGHAVEAAFDRIKAAVDALESREESTDGR